MGMNSEQEMSKQETKTTLVSQYVVIGGTIGGVPVDGEMGTQMVLVRAQYCHQRTNKQKTVTTKICG